MTVLNCNTFCFLVDKRSNEDCDCQSSSGSELPRAVHLQRFESVPGQLSCTLSTPCSGLWKLEGKKKKKSIKYLVIYLYILVLAVYLLGSKMLMFEAGWRGHVPTRVFLKEERLHITVFLVLENTVISSLCRARPSLRLQKREQSRAAKHCCCNVLSSSDMSFLQTMQSLHWSHEQYKRNCKMESISLVGLELETLLPSS